MSRKQTIAELGSAVLRAFAFRPGTPGRRMLRRTVHSVRSRARYLSGWLRGVGYQLSRHHPDENVADLVLADRIRSSLGPVERRLDLPHIHVMVHNHIALLHGDVATEDDREILEQTVADVSGVQGVESNLHVGLLRSDTRPSEGRSRPQPSEAHRRLSAW